MKGGADLRKVGKAQFYLGQQGAGNNAKLAINTLLAFNMQGLAESVLFASEHGISRKPCWPSSGKAHWPMRSRK
jgi:3-hydroxyisobutyrate dehydrogenase-like beta-hydroxyacid dehydrogenase